MTSYAHPTDPPSVVGTVSSLSSSLSPPPPPPPPVDTAHASSLLRPPPDDRSPLQRAPSVSTTSSGRRLSSSLGDDHLNMATRTSGSVSSHRSRLTSDTSRENRFSQRSVRSLPPWIESFDAASKPNARRPPFPASLLTPTPTHAAHHHFAAAREDRRVSQDGFVDYDEAPETWEKAHERGLFSREPERGRKWDHAREHTPVIVKSATNPTSGASMWTSFIRASQYGTAHDEERARVDDKFLQDLNPGFDRPWGGSAGDSTEHGFVLLRPRHRRRLFKKVQHILLMHPLVPLFFRLIVLTTSTVALALAASIYQMAKRSHYREDASTTMAIIVDVVAIPYICYITWDEYTGKPLGLRSPKAKIRLVLLDLFFIIFESANISLAFQALTDYDGSCTTGDNGVDRNICNREKALCGILLVAIIAWSLTFSVSIFRLVDRVGGREDS